MTQQMNAPTEAMANVLKLLIKERKRQVRMWGEENLPDFAPHLINRPGGVEGSELAKHHGIDFHRAVNACDEAEAQGNLSWMHILTEEVGELLIADGHDELRDELVQVAAVAVAWVEAIDRKGAAEQAKRCKEGRHKKGRNKHVYLGGAQWVVECEACGGAVSFYTRESDEDRPTEDEQAAIEDVGQAALTYLGNLGGEASPEEPSDTHSTPRWMFTWSGFEFYWYEPQRLWWQLQCWWRGHLMKRMRKVPCHEYYCDHCGVVMALTQEGVEQ